MGFLSYLDLEPSHTKKVLQKVIEVIKSKPDTYFTLEQKIVTNWALLLLKQSRHEIDYNLDIELKGLQKISDKYKSMLSQILLADKKQVPIEISLTSAPSISRTEVKIVDYIKTVLITKGVDFKIINGNLPEGL